MDEEKPLRPIFIVSEGRNLRCLLEADWLPLDPFNEAVQVRECQREFYRVTLTNLLNRARVGLSLHGVFMDPCLSPRCPPITMLAIRALHPIEFILCTVNLILTEELVFGTDRDGHNRQFLNNDPGSLRNQLAAEDTIDANASIVAEGDGLGPRVALLEEDVLEVLGDEAILYRVAVVIEGLLHVISPLSAQAQGPAVENLVKLDE